MFLQIKYMKRIFAFFAALLVGVAAFAQEAQDPDVVYGKDLLAAGTVAPSFTLKDIDGKSVSLSDFRGKQVVLHFWASWCPDCREETPQLKAAQAAADPSKVVFVSVSFDRKMEAFEAYVHENALGGVQLFDASGKKESLVGTSYHVKWIPATYLIGPDGRIQFATVVFSKVAAKLK